MHKLRRYIISNFSISFFSIFLPLFAIASVIFMLKLATYTAYIQLSFFEMFKLYLFVLPELFFYTLPITFFIAAVLALFRLSTDNEMVILFTLGIKPNYLIKVLLVPALLLSSLLVFNFFYLFPHVKTISINFMKHKKSEAKFNISASEFGHNFGSWLLYVGKDNEDKSFGNVVLFNKDKDEEVLISAEHATVDNTGGILRLELEKGKGYNYTSDTLTQMKFETLFINNIMTTDQRKYLSAYDYWFNNEPDLQKIHTKKFISDLLLSLFPLLSLFMVLAIGVAHVRHQKAYVYLFLFLSIVVYYGSSIGLVNLLGYYTIPVVLGSWLAVTYPYYRRKIVSRF
ncbi:MAG: LptF/LptG family permease [Helicobacteraceae bacterium]|jgi:lipopolysaccharide export system permease protein|nr:LptF/LptG family permease [Helicobacteraceae bacterium]